MDTEMMDLTACLSQARELQKKTEQVRETLESRKRGLENKISEIDAALVLLKCGAHSGRNIQQTKKSRLLPEPAAKKSLLLPEPAAKKSSDDAWDKNFPKLKAHCEEWNDLPDDDGELARWCTDYCMKVRSKNKNLGPVTTERAAKLEALPCDWRWESRTARWNRYAGAVKSYMANAVCMMERDALYGPPHQLMHIGSWAHTQVIKYHNGALQARQVNFLDDIAGWAWVLTITWDAHLKIAESVEVLSDMTIKSEIEIGAWCKFQEHKLTKGLLTKTQSQKFLEFLKKRAN